MIYVAVIILHITFTNYNSLCLELVRDFDSPNVIKEYKVSGYTVILNLVTLHNVVLLGCSAGTHTRLNT